MVNKERMQLWLDALRSRRFKQGREHLKYTRGGQDFYCCLGVACEVAIANGLDLPVREPSCDSFGWKFGSFEESSWLPAEVRQWLGVESTNPWMHKEYGRGTVAASKANDHFNWTFEKIADALERTYLTDKEENNG